MQNYLNLLNEVVTKGSRQANRTGVDAISIPGAMLKFDLAEGFPAVTTKRLAFKSVVGELLGFIRGYDNAADFRAFGCNVWDANANEPGLPGSPNRWLNNSNRKGHDDLGRIYGKQWTDWRGKGILTLSEPVIGGDGSITYSADTKLGYESINQLKVAIETIENDPTNRRIIVNAWRPDEFDQMALPPCHILFQFLVNVERKELSLCWYQRSCDSFLGIPFNIASYALLLSLVAEVTSYKPRHLTGFLADTHVYVNHLEQVRLQTSRNPFSPPQLRLSIPQAATAYERLLATAPENIELMGYERHPAIKAEMAV